MAPAPMSRLRRLCLAFVVVVPLLLLGRVPVLASRHTSRDASASLPTIRWPGMTAVQWFPSLDPAQAVDTLSLAQIAKVFASLVQRLPTNGNIVPDLATFDVSKNHLVYTFHIRKNARFSNGDQVTAQDAVWTIERFLRNAPGSTTQIGIIEGAPDYATNKSNSVPGLKIINSKTLRITTTDVNVNFLRYLATWAGTVLDRKVMEGKNASANNNTMTNTCSANVGSGPFMYQCRNKGDGLDSFYPSGQTPGVTLIPNPKYYGRHPNFKLQEFSIKDAQTAFLDFQAGQIDWAGVPTANISEEKSKKGFLHFPSFLVWYVSPAFDMPPFDNVHCRLAVAYGINTTQIDKDVLHGAWTPVHGMMPKPILGYYNGKDNPQYNPTKAKSELAQCPGGIHDQKLLYQASSADFDNVFGGAIPAQLSALGIDIKGNGVPAANWVKVATSPQKSTGNPIIQSGLTQVDSGRWCNLRVTNFNLNSSGYTNPQYDALCTKAAKTFDLKKRAAIYRQTQHIAMSAGVFIPIGQVQNFAIYKTTINGLVGDALYGILAPKNYDWANLSITKKK